MSDGSTQVKDLTEMERLLVGSSINFVYNLISNQIYHIENHDPDMTELLRINEAAQEDYILLQNFRKTAEDMTKVFGETFIDLPMEDLAVLSQPAMKLERFFHEIFEAIACGHE